MPSGKILAPPDLHPPASLTPDSLTLPDWNPSLELWLHQPLVTCREKSGSEGANRDYRLGQEIPSSGRLGMTANHEKSRMGAVYPSRLASTSTAIRFKIEVELIKAELCQKLETFG
jgi:hypothetical protein